MLVEMLDKPDWGGSVDETLQWGVSRVRSRNGAAEYVELVAPWPTRYVRVGGWVDVLTDRASLDLAPGEELIPWLPGRTRILSSVSSSEFEVGGDPADRGFVVGESALIQTPDGEREVVTVGAVASTLHTSADPTITIVTGTTIMPLLRAEIGEDQAAVVRLSPRAASFELSWRIVDTQFAGADDAADESWTLDFDGDEVCVRLAESTETQLVGSERYAGLGGAWRRIVPGAGQTLITQRHTIMSAAELTELRQWLYRRRGPLMPCWVPLGMSLGDCVVETHESLAVLEVDDPGSTVVHDLRQAIVVWPRSGTPTAHRVGGVLRYGSATVPEGRAWLTGLDPVLSHTDILGAQWIVHCRMDETVTIQWHSPEVASLVLQWLSTPEEA